MSEPIVRLNTALEGRYRVEREIGEGGMATVYLADDLRHERKVALKVLKPELAAVVGADRFLAEIKTTAGLQHPHILPLHDSGEADGFLFYVMPFIEGETLRERIDRDKQLPVEEAVRIAAAVANALHTAHEAGIVHRDIKPGNILLSRGEPLVADFGIALAVGAAGGSRLTETGLSVGTPFYMSPEQATGDQSLGPASDTYALACVLYEMLTGDPPYMGNTAQAVLGKIIQGAPVSATALRKSIPPNVDAAIQRALEKLPADRFTSAHDFARALVDPAFRHGPESAALAAQSGRARAAGYAGWGVAAILAAIVAWGATRPEPIPPVNRLALDVEEDRLPGNIAVPPDGSGVVYVQSDASGAPRSQLWVQRWGSLDPTPIPGTEAGGGDHILSPDGEEVAFVENGNLKVAPLAGGVVRTLTDSAVCCLRWANDGYIYYSPIGRTISRISAAGGEPEPLTERLEEGGDGPHGHFEVLEGEDVAVFTVWGSPVRIEAMRLSTGERKVLIAGARPFITSTGHLVFGSLDGQVMAAPFDAESMELSGPAVPLIEGMWVSPNENPAFGLSDEGTLVYWSGSGGDAGQRQLVRASRSGQVAPIDPNWTFTRGDVNTSWAVSPDGSQLVLRELTDDGLDLWVKQLPDGPRSRLTFDDRPDYSPRWHPQGRLVTYVSGTDASNLDVYTRPANGTGSAELLVDLEFSIAQANWSPDGEWLVMRTTTGLGAVFGRDIVAIRPGVDEAPTLLMTAEFDETDPIISPDGRWIAYTSNETERYEVYVRPFPDVDSDRWQISTIGGFAPRWGPNSDEIFFIDADRNMASVRVDTSVGFEASAPEPLFQLAPDIEVGNFTVTVPYEVMPDGESFILARTPAREGEEPTAPKLILVQNFLEEVKARVPN